MHPRNGFFSRLAPSRQTSKDEQTAPMTNTLPFAIFVSAGRQDLLQRERLIAIYLKPTNSRDLQKLPDRLVRFVKPCFACTGTICEYTQQLADPLSDQGLQMLDIVNRTFH